ncbi:MAG: PAS domain-containing sensor histidine kinase, partial [Ignavibacteria bacterium]
MFDEIKHIESAILSETENSFFIIDKEGIIVSVSGELKKELVGVKNIFDVLTEKSRKRLSDPLITGVTEAHNLILERTDANQKLEAEIHSIQMDGKELFKINVRTIEPLDQENVTLVLRTGRIENALSKASKEILDVIKSNFPFTLIGRAKTQKKVEEFEGIFWLKDPKGKILLSNTEFAEFLGTTKKQVENKYEEEVFPKYFFDAISGVNKYTFESGNECIIDDQSGFLFLHSVGRAKLVQIPLFDIEKNIIAIINLTDNFRDLNSFEHAKQIEINFQVSDWLIPALVIEQEGKVLSYSGSATKLFTRELMQGSLNLLDLLNSNNRHLFENFIRNDSDIKTQFNQELDGRFFRFTIQKIVGKSDSRLALVILERIRQEKTSSDKMYDVILQEFPLPALIYDAENLRFLEVNSSALELYGYSRDEFLSMDLTDLYAPEDIQSLIEKPQTGKSNGNGLLMRQKRKDGSFIIVEIFNRQIDFNGKPALISSIVDKSREFELDKKNQLYKSSFEHSNDPIAITDNHGFVKFINDSFISKLGYTKAEMEQNPIASIFADADRSILNANLYQNDYPEERRFTLTLKTAEGKELEADVIGTPIFGYKEKVERYSLIFKLKDSQVVVEETNGGLKKSGIDTNFLSNLFHELLTPLNVIIGFVQELSESIDNPNEEQREAIQIIEENQKVLLQTMDIAVEFSHLEQDYVDLNVSDIRFVELLDDLKDSTKKTAESNEVDLNYGKISSSLQFKTDRHKFVTFLSQMLHFSMIMTHESEIIISGYPHGKNKFAIGIKDSKNGISEELLSNLKAVFEDDEINIRRNYGLSRFTVRLVRKLLQILSAEIHPLPSAANPSEFGIVFPVELHVPEAS